jgi:hypothetical protein
MENLDAEELFRSADEKAVRNSQKFILHIRGRDVIEITTGERANHNTEDAEYAEGYWSRNRDRVAAVGTGQDL